ncbi:Uncharacterised protein [Prevotella intermedia]|nr:Uncharacterised protein [Prevotella intermedia]
MDCTHATRMVSPNTSMYTQITAHVKGCLCLYVHTYRFKLAILTSIKHVQISKF